MHKNDSSKSLQERTRTGLDVGPTKANVYLVTETPYPYSPELIEFLKKHPGAVVGLGSGCKIVDGQQRWFCNQRVKNKTIPPKKKKIT